MYTKKVRIKSKLKIQTSEQNSLRTAITTVGKAMTASSGGGQNAPFNGAVHSLADKSNHRHSRQGTSAKSSPMNPAEPAAYKHENSLLIAGDENLSVDDVVAAIKTKYSIEPSAVLALAPVQSRKNWSIQLKSDAYQMLKKDVGQQIALNAKCNAKICDPSSADLIAKTSSVIRLHFLPLDVDLALVRQHVIDAKIAGANIERISRETHRSESLKHAASGVIRVKISHSHDVKDQINDMYGYAKIGRHRALVSVVGAAIRCMKCKQAGHIQTNCTAKSCGKCKAFTHQTENCTMAASIAGREQEKQRAEFKELSEEFLAGESETEKSSNVLAGNYMSLGSAASINRRLPQQKRNQDMRSPESEVKSSKEGKLDNEDKDAEDSDEEDSDNEDMETDKLTQPPPPSLQQQQQSRAQTLQSEQQQHKQHQDEKQQRIQQQKQQQQQTQKQQDQQQQQEQPTTQPQQQQPMPNSNQLTQNQQSNLPQQLQKQQQLQQQQQLPPAIQQQTVLQQPSASQPQLQQQQQLQQPPQAQHQQQLQPPTQHQQLQLTAQQQQQPPMLHQSQQQQPSAQHQHQHSLQQQQWKNFQPQLIVRANHNPDSHQQHQPAHTPIYLPKSNELATTIGMYTHANEAYSTTAHAQVSTSNHYSILEDLTGMKPGDTGLAHMLPHSSTQPSQ